jgi:hypothetical protein
MGGAKVMIKQQVDYFNKKKKRFGNMIKVCDKVIVSYYRKVQGLSNSQLSFNIVTIDHC